MHDSDYKEYVQNSKQFFHWLTRKSIPEIIGMDFSSKADAIFLVYSDILPQLDQHF